jgi:hypothetical protein
MQVANPSMVRRMVVVALVVLSAGVAAQESRVYAGGSVSAVTQTHSAGEPLGGTTWGGSAVFGVQVSPRVAVEFEPSFGGPYSWEYTYRPSTTVTADVVASRRDSFYSFQVRTRVGVLEPVVGLGYVHGRISRHATFDNGTPYFDDSRSDNGLAFVGGLDAAVKLTSRLQFVPTFRLLARGQPAIPVNPFNGDPLGRDTRTGLFVLRYGAGVRVIF